MPWRLRGRIKAKEIPAVIAAVAVAAMILVVIWLMSKPPPPQPIPFIEITLVPPRGIDDQAMHQIAGRVGGIADLSQYAAVVYAFTSEWFVQPTIIEPLTQLDRDGAWSTTTHEGFQYAAVLVKKPYTPMEKGSAFPVKQGNVIASVTVDGKPPK